jgi:iron complex transport system ATP-binding protein
VEATQGRRNLGVGPAVRLRAAEVRIEGRTVLGPVDLQVGRGERWVLLGPNGGGKTTLLALAGARRQPSSGTVEVLGTPLGRGDVRALHPRISHTSHVLAGMIDPTLPVLTVVLTGKRSTLSPWFQRFGPDDERRARDLLERVGCGALAARRFASGSQGERQRILLARALFPEPELLILDEPASGLDLPSRELLLEAIEAAARAVDPPTTIVATHHLEEIPPSTTHAALLRAGRLMANGPIDDVLTADRLGETFGIGLEAGRRPDGRWWATSLRRPEGPSA